MVNSQNLKASVSFVGDGTTNKFYFGFDYINKQFIKVQVGEGEPLTYPNDYTVEDRYVILNDTPSTGVPIRVYRETTTERIVEWADGAFIKASQMTLENLQQLHLIEEAQDYPILNSLSTYPDGVNFNALGSRVINVSDPKDPQDVVTKHYMENVQNGFVSANTILVQEATKQASAAKSSQEAAKTSETNAKTSETNSELSHQNAKKWAEDTESPDGETDTDSMTGKTQSSRSWALYSKAKAQEAATSATNAKASETNAKASETNAKSSETKAKTSETNALTSEQHAKTSETNAKTSETNSEISHQLAKKWAEATDSPDGEVDTNSPTGYTQSAKIWAALSKEYAGLSKFKLPMGYYSSVDEMRKSETAIVGRPCVTLGYYEPNDGGGAVYIIRSKKESDVDDGGSILVLDNGNVAELIIDGAVNVKQFGAKGDGVTDDTAIIQKVIDYTDQSTKHSIVYLPTGNYRITAPVYLRQDMIMCGDGNVRWQWGKISRGLTVGTTLIADFENIEDAAVVIASTDRNGVQNNFNHNRWVSGASHDNGNNKACDNVQIKNITVYTAKNVAIGILGIVSTSCKLDLVSVIGFRYGVYVSACWGSSYTRLFVYTEFGGICLIDSAHDNCISNSYINQYDQQHELTDDNNLLPIESGYYGKAKIGIYSRYSSGIHSNSNITEHWEIAYNMTQCTFVCNSPYMEGISKYCYQTLNCGMTINGPVAVSPSATFLRYVNTNGAINGYSKYNGQFKIKSFVTGRNDDSLSSIVVSGIFPTTIEVTSKHLHYADVNPHEVYVDTDDGTINGLGTKNSPVKNITNISFKETNTTVYLKYGQTINITSGFDLGAGKSITFNAYGDSKLARPKIVIIPVDPGSYSRGLVSSDSNIYFKNIDLEILAGDGQVQPDESQLFTVSGRTHISFKSCNIKIAEHKSLFSPYARWGETNFLSVWVDKYSSVPNTLTLGATSMLVKADYSQRSHITVCGMKDNDFFPQDIKYYTRVCTHYEDIIAATKAYLSK